MAEMCLTDAPFMSPAQCKLCGSATRLPFLDTGVLEDFYGAVYYCGECVGHMAAFFGYVDKKSYKATTESLTRADCRVIELEEQLEAALYVVTALDSLKGILNVNRSNSADPVGVSDVSIGSGQLDIFAELERERISPTVAPLGEPKVRTSQSVNV